MQKNKLRQKPKASRRKGKKDLENKKLLGLVQDTEENQEEEPIIKKKETKEEVKKNLQHQKKENKSRRI